MKQKTVKHLGEVCKGPTISQTHIGRLQSTLRSIKEIDNAQVILKVLAGATRLKILILLHQVGKLCVCDMAEVLDTTVSAVSHQLQRLKKRNLVTAHREAQTIYYSLVDKKKIQLILEALDLM